MKICLAGTGAMGEVHMNALQKLDDVQVISVNALTEAEGKAFAEKWKIPFQSTRLEECIDRPGVDAVVLTTPSQMHAEQAIIALNKGKHVEVEIPMSLNLPDAEKIREVAAKSGKICMITHSRRFSAPHREIRRRIKDGSFHLQHVVVETYFFRRTNLNMLGKPRTWVDNLLWHHACHSVDLAYWILNDPDLEVWGQKGPDHPELHVPMDMTIGMRSKKMNTMISMVLSFNNKGPFGGFYRYIGEEETYKVFRDAMTDGEGKDIPLAAPPAYDLQDHEFVGAIREGRQPESNAASCVPTMALLDKIEKSMAINSL